MSYEYELPNTGECPEWLAEDDLVLMKWDEDDFWYPHWTPWEEVICKERLVAIRLEDHHPAIPTLEGGSTDEGAPLCGGCGRDPDLVEEMANVIHKFASDEYKGNFGPLWTEVRRLSKKLQRAELKKKYLVEPTSEWDEGWNAAVEDIINDLA